MRKMILLALALGLFGTTLVGCHAEADVDKPHGSTMSSVLPLPQ